VPDLRWSKSGDTTDSPKVTAISLPWWMNYEMFDHTDLGGSLTGTTRSQVMPCGEVVLLGRVVNRG
jgi:hypothetical protein